MIPCIEQTLLVCFFLEKAFFMMVSILPWFPPNLQQSLGFTAGLHGNKQVAQRVNTPMNQFCHFSLPPFNNILPAVHVAHIDLFIEKFIKTLPSDLLHLRVPLTTHCSTHTWNIYESQFSFLTILVIRICYMLWSVAVSSGFNFYCQHESIF